MAIEEGSIANYRYTPEDFPMQPGAENRGMQSLEAARGAHQAMLRRLLAEAEAGREELQRDMADNQVVPMDIDP